MVRAAELVAKQRGRRLSPIVRLNRRLKHGEHAGDAGGGAIRPTGPGLCGERSAFLWAGPRLDRSLSGRPRRRHVYRRWLHAVRGPAERLPFDDATFDIAATRFSAHHWGDLDAGLRDVARVLKPNGLFLVADSAAPAKPLLDTHLQAVEVLRDPSHVRNYTATEWVAALGRSGFVVGEIRAARVLIEFGSWVERMKTPDVAVAAIRRLQSTAPDEVQRHFAIEADGSFLLDTVWIEATTR